MADDSTTALRIAVALEAILAQLVLLNAELKKKHEVDVTGIVRTQ